MLSIDSALLIVNTKTQGTVLCVLLDFTCFSHNAWCLMPRHIHLLLKESPGGETISQIMKRIGVR